MHFHIVPPGRPGLGVAAAHCHWFMSPIAEALGPASMGTSVPPPLVPLCWTARRISLLHPSGFEQYLHKCGVRSCSMQEPREVLAEHTAACTELAPL